MTDERLWKLLLDSNERLTRHLLNQPPDEHGPQVHYLFGRPLGEIAKIIDEHDARTGTGRRVS